ncbi:hypothetical protein FXO37_27473 [Capsicum annuum]|nr:hypothetical protein FXO37_27473 [Capsicum annuum]
MGLLPRQNWDKVEPKEEASYSFMHAPLGSGDIARLVELRSCNWVVAITGWMSNCPNDSILYLNRWLTFSDWVGGSPRVPLSEISGEDDQVDPCEQLDALSSFNPLSEMRQKKRKENPWTDPIISTLSDKQQVPDKARIDATSNKYPTRLE